jgi:hypothetical protein
MSETNELKRRVLLTGVVALVLFLTTAWTVAWLQVADAWLLVAMVVEYLVVIRPLMAPVRESVKLRRRLAYQAWLDENGKK